MTFEQPRSTFASFKARYPHFLTFSKMTLRLRVSFVRFVLLVKRTLRSRRFVCYGSVSCCMVNCVNRFQKGSGIGFYVRLSGGQ